LSEYEIILIILGVVVPIVSGLTAWKAFKAKLNMIRKLIDTVDDAIYDDKVTENEFRVIWNNFTELATSFKHKTPGD
jgi:hypothetical protein